MVRESLDVLRYDEVHTFHTIVDVTDFEDFGVVAQHVWRHLEGRHVDDVDVGVLCGEDSTDLGVFALEELIHGDALGLLD